MPAWLPTILAGNKSLGIILKIRNETENIDIQISQALKKQFQVVLLFFRQIMVRLELCRESANFLVGSLVLLAVVLVFISASEDMGAVGYIVALGGGISGLFLVMMAQFIRATVSNADMTREILRLLQTKSQ